MNKSIILINSINEIFDSKYPIGKTHVENKYDGDYQHKTVHFGSVDGQQKYTAEITSNFHRKEATVAFHDHNDDNHITNNQRSSSHKIIGTVKQIAQEHMRKYPELDSIKFHARSSETGRVKLYRTLAKSVAHKHTEEEPSSFVHFSIHRKDLK